MAPRASSSGSEDYDGFVLQLCCYSIEWTTFLAPLGLNRRMAVGVPVADSYASKTRYLSAVLFVTRGTTSSACGISHDGTMYSLRRINICATASDEVSRAVSATSNYAPKPPSCSSLYDASLRHCCDVAAAVS
jgi:hypothetical protein